MSQAYLVVGVCLEQLIKNVTKTENVKKFNENTGQPYDKEVSVTTSYICGRPFCDDEDEDDPESIFKKHGLDFINGGYESPRPTVVGISLYDVADCNSSGGHIELVDPEVVAGATKRAVERFASMGYDGPVRMFLVMREQF